MEKYYLVRKDSEIYNKLKLVKTFYKGWFEKEFKEKMVKLIGYDYGTRFICNDRALCLEEVPEELDKQFSVELKPFADGGYYRKAKKNSKINKAYLELCKEYNLKTYDFSDFAFDCFTFKPLRALYPLNTNEYVLKFACEINNDDLVEILESEFLMRWAETVKENEKKKAMED